MGPYKPLSTWFDLDNFRPVLCDWTRVIKRLQSWSAAEMPGGKYSRENY